MADDVAGAVRRTPHPADDHQTPETTTPVAPGATNPGAPVSQDAGAFCVDGCPCGQTGPAAAACALDTATDVEAYAALPECTACEGTGKDQHGSPFEQPLAIHIAAPPCTIDGRRRQLCAWCGHVLIDTRNIGGPDHVPAWPDGHLIRIEDGVGRVEPYEHGNALPPGCCALPDDEPADDDLCGKHVAGTSSNRCLLAAGHIDDCSDEPAPCARCLKNPPAELFSAHPVNGRFCAACIDRCHEATEFDHTCPVCQQPEDGPDEPPAGHEDIRALRFHLASVHKNAAAFDLLAVDLDDVHQHDHFGPCGLRNHDVADRSYDEAEARAVVAEADDGPDEAQETRAAADWPAEPVDTSYDEQEADRG